MQKEKIEKKLISLFEKWSKNKALTISVLPRSGSDRQYFRIQSKNKTAIGVYNPDKKENLAFITFTRHFLKKKINVPSIYIEDLKNDIYLLEDLGDVTLFNFLTQHKQDKNFSTKQVNIYKKIVAELPKIQIKAGKDLNYKVCYPRASFDKQSMMWDLNYFKYYFLKLAKIKFDEQALENDFKKFTDFLLQAEKDYFLYRDFQSRNIMLVKNKVYFIDYQGGRQGALQYDLASLLYDAKADIPQKVRDLLLNEYLKSLSKIKKVNKQEFVRFYQGFVLIRIMQALGAYGFRGFYEKKEHFLLSIPYAVENLKYLLSKIDLPVKIPTLRQVWQDIVLNDELKKFGQLENKLQIDVMSFSYKKVLPIDSPGPKGYFVFDCRGLNNPGRYEKYKKLDGRDKQVVDFLAKEKDLKLFLKNTFALVDMTVENYLQRKFTHLSVAFGCTGGRHRSVFCAEQMAQHLKHKFNIDVELTHREL